MTASEETLVELTQQHLDPSNPFAFSPEQLYSIVYHKRLDILESIGGVDGLARGLHSNTSTGLDWREENLCYIRLHDLKQPPTKDEYYMPPDKLLYNDKEEYFVQRANVFGPNRLPELEPVSLLKIMWEAYQDKTLLLLTASAVISLTVGIYEDLTIVEYDALGNRVPGVKWVEGVAIVIAVSLVVIVSSVNDYQKEKQFRDLNAKKEDRQVTAIRSGEHVLLSVYDVQVGDVLQLEPGDIVCADGVFIQGHNLKCDESPLTGESDAVRKLSWNECHTSFEDEDTARPLDPFLISGSRVLEGLCTYMVTAVGPYSFHGRTLMALRTKDENTPLQDKLDILASSIAKFGLSSAAFLFTMLIVRCVVGYATGSLSTVPSDVVAHIMAILITTVTVIVVAVPEGLPLAVTLALAFATQRMLKDNNLVRVLAACETMGSATTICSDKTGTLTENKMSVVAGTFGSSFRFLKDPPKSRPDLFSVHELGTKVPLVIKRYLNQALALNSTAFSYQQMLVGNKTETALLNFSRDHLDSEPFELLRARWPIEVVFPFSSSRKAMATVIRVSKQKGGTIYRMHVKGASEVLLRQCNRIVSMHDTSYDQDASEIVTRVMTEANRERMVKIIQSYATRCLRTLAICYQDMDHWTADQQLEDVLQQGQLTLLGIVGIEDPLREGVTDAVAACQRAGVCVRMVTGDNMMTAKSIARQCGIYVNGSIALDGSSFRKMSRQERQSILPQLRVLARSSPEDKRLLVNDLRQLGEVVAVTGDGTNDGPALKAADVGFSMGIAGTEVAKEASSIILMDDNFSSIVKAISWGRCVNDSVKKFLQFQLTVNVTAVMLTILSAMGSQEQKSILTAVQLLWVNLIMDTFAALALATDPPSADLLKRSPESKSAPLINTSMWKMIIGQSIYQIGVILVFLYTNILGLKNEPATLQTVVFTIFVFCQIFNEINCRRIDNKLNIFKGIRNNKFFILIFTISVCGQVIIVERGGAAFQTIPLGISHWLLSVFIGLCSIPIGVILRLIPDKLFYI
ncbi:Putative Calcium-translocating P-type ATPase, PMCA-type [Rhizopus microsporus]|nr:Putative Calcium-translocating P-type ATPase, PMCA-type [Rhizopus microsporus]